MEIFLSTPYNDLVKISVLNILTSKQSVEMQYEFPSEFKIFKDNLKDFGNVK